MLAGGRGRTNNWTFTFYWPTEGDRQDFAFRGRVGKWLGENARVLDKKSATECVKQVAAEFPELSSVEAADHHDRLARVTL
jgi:hypothetical protein